MPRSYGHIKEIFSIKIQGKTNREMCEKSDTGLFL